MGLNAAQRTIAVIGDAWTLRILRAVFRGKRRFSDFVDELGVSRAVLTNRLVSLSAHQVLSRVVADGRHPEYFLTDRGLDLWSLFLAMWLWEKDWGANRYPDTWAPDLPRAQLVHADCGHVMRPHFRCMKCQVEVRPFDTALTRITDETPGNGAEETQSAFRRARQSPARHDAARQSQTLIRVVGDRWNSAIVAAAFRGVRSFSGFEHVLRIGPTQLSDRLGELLRLGVLRVHANEGGRKEYRLTKAGISLFPTVLEMVRWGNHWMRQEDQPLSILHRACGHELVVRWHCGQCGKELERESVRFS